MGSETVLDRIRANTRDGELPFRAMAGMFAAEAVIARITLEGALDLLGKDRPDLAASSVREALASLLEVERASTVLCEEGLGLRPRSSENGASGA